MFQAQRSPDRIRIYIIDPQPLIAAALQHFFDAHPAFTVVGSAQAASSLILHTARPDVIVVCQEHGSPDVCDTVLACRTAAPSAKVCVIACHAHPELVPRVIEAGAGGYAIKDVNPGDLIDAIVHVHGGSVYVDPRISLRGRRSGNDGTPSSENLSLREIEVLKLIAEGYSNREISIALALSEKTIKNHISRIFAKLHITARTQAVVHAIKAGIA